jgi:hypothetical protein
MNTTRCDAAAGYGRNIRMAATATLRSDATFIGYASPRHDESSFELGCVRRGTPAGEYLRRFWHPVAYLDELKDVPLRAKILGENLVVFRDGSGDVGVLLTAATVAPRSSSA